MYSKGLDGCMAFARVLFGDAKTEAKKEEIMPARSRLQALVQQYKKTSDTIRFELENLHAPNEAHKAEFRSHVYIAEMEWGVGVGRTRKAADASACEDALSKEGLVDWIKAASK